MASQVVTLPNIESLIEETPRIENPSSETPSIERSTLNMERCHCFFVRTEMMDPITPQGAHEQPRDP